MTHEQIKRAAALLASLERLDREIVALKRATRVSAYAQDFNGNHLAKFERIGSDKAPFDEHGETVHRFLLKLHRAGREKVARELRQLSVSVPEIA